MKPRGAAVVRDLATEEPSAGRAGAMVGLSRTTTSIRAHPVRLAALDRRERIGFRRRPAREAFAEAHRAGERGVKPESAWTS